MIASGTFREDLFYRCNVFAIRVPSLRERLEDLPYLVDDILAGAIDKLGITAPPAVEPAVIDALRGYRWPGNVRELENALVRAAIASEGRPIGISHLPPAILSRRSVRPPKPDLMKTLAEIERAHINAVLEACGGHVESAAKRLGIGRASLYRKLREMGPRAKS
jgi:DNA-binding NtrC family response regulator